VSHRLRDTAGCLSDWETTFKIKLRAGENISAKR
jgi:hypothetical protein